MSSKIIRLEAENVKRLKAIRITPTGAVIRIGGRNAQGKTTVLDCIQMVLGGKDAVPAEPIRRGERRGKILLETDDIIATRVFGRAGSTSVEVTNKEGVRFNSPQAVLDKLTNSLCFDPHEFKRAGETPEGRRKQLRMLRDLAGVDTSELDQKRKALFEDRTVQNRLIEQQKGVLANLPTTGPKRVDVSAVLAEIKKAQDANQKIAELEIAARETFVAAGRVRGDVEELEEELNNEENRLNSCKVALRSAIDNVAKQTDAIVEGKKDAGPLELIDLEPLRKALADAEAHNEGVHAAQRQLEAMENELSTRRHAQSRVEGDVAAIEKELAERRIKLDAKRSMLVSLNSKAEEAKALVVASKRIDITPLQQQIADAEKVNLEAAKFEQRRAEDEKLGEYERKAEELTDKIADLDKQREELIASGKIPVEGLSFGEDGVTFNGIPLEQASSAEQYRVGLAVACAMNPKLPVMLIRDGSLLDEDSMKLVEEFAEKHGAQVWIEMVGKNDKMTVIIEDGMVEEPEEEPEPVAAGKGKK